MHSACNLSGQKNRGKLIIVIIFLLFCFWCSSCEGDGSDIHTTHHFQETGILEINLDSLTSIDATSIIPSYFNDTLNLFITNELNNSVDVYDEASKELKKRFRFEREGPDGISQIRTTVVKNRDSIYVIGKFHIVNSKLINWEGDIINGRPIDFAWSGNKYNIVNHVSNIIQSGEFFYVTIGALFDINNPNSFDQSFSYEYRYDLKNQTLEELPVYEPLSYVGQAHNFYSVVPSRTLDNNGWLIYSWPEEEMLEVRNIQNLDSVLRVDAHINSFGMVLKGTVGKRSSKEQLKEALDHLLYIKILYDPFRNLYYRIASLPTGEYEPSDLRHWSAFGRNKIGIIAMNGNFDIIGYTILKSEMYNCYRAFVGKKGLYISKNNIYRKDFNENLLEYSVFELVLD